MAALGILKLLARAAKPVIRAVAGNAARPVERAAVKTVAKDVQPRIPVRAPAPAPVPRPAPKINVNVARPIVPDSAKIVKPLETKVPKIKIAKPTNLSPVAHQENVFQRMFSSTSSRLGRMGEGGKQLSSSIKSARNRSELLAADITGRIPTVLKLGNKEMDQFTRHLEDMAKGVKPKVTNPKIVKALEEWRTTMPAVHGAASKVLPDIGNLGEHYFPRSYTEALSKKAGLDDAAQHLVKTGQAKDLPSAYGVLNHQRDFLRNRPYGHLESSRNLDLPNYDRTSKAVGDYVQGVSERIAHAEHFGHDNNIAHQLIAKIGQEGHDTGKALDLFNTAVGNKVYGETATKVSAGIRQFNALRSLGSSAVANATQLVNTASVVGVKNTVKAIALRKQYAEWTHATGVNSGALLQRIMDQAGFGKGLVGDIAAPGFRQVEGFNRDVASIAGRLWAEQLAKQGKHGLLLRKLGIEAGDTLTPEQATQAGRKMVELTQFKVDPQDLPMWASSPAGKLVAQFRTFVYKQSEFVANELIKEAVKHGNVGPFARFVSIGIPLGMAGGSIRSTIKGQDISMNPIDALQNVGGFGFAGDLERLATSSGNSLPQNIAGAVGGPTAGFAVRGLEALGAAKNGNNDPLLRQAAGMIPVVGARVAQNVAPYNKPRGGEVNSTLQALIKQATGKEYQVASDKQAISETGDYLTPEEQAFAYLKSKNPEFAKGYANQPGNEYLKKIDDKKRAATQIVKGVQTNLPEGISEPSTKVLQNYDRLTTEGKKKFMAKGQNEYDYEIAKYERDVLDGKIVTETDKYTRSVEIAKLDIAKDYGQESRDLYSKSKAAISKILDSVPNPDKVYAELVDMDRRLYDAGLIAKRKFANGLGNLFASASGGGRGKKAKTIKAPRPRVATSVPKAKPPKMAKMKTSSAKLKIAMPKKTKGKKITFTA